MTWLYEIAATLLRSKTMDAPPPPTIAKKVGGGAERNRSTIEVMESVRRKKKDCEK